MNGDRNTLSATSNPTASVTFLDGGGVMGAHIRQFDWTSTALGAPETWPESLRTALRILLTTNHPVFIFWGESQTCFYNDAYARSLGPEQHPRILGMPGREAWQEIWHLLEPQIAFVRRGDGATWNENQLIPITRHGRRDAVYWTYSYGPIHDERAPNAIGGVLVLCTETTAQVLAEARQRDDASRWRTIFEQSPAFMCVLRGPEHRFEYANPRYLDLIERDHIEPGSRVADVLPEVVAQGFIDLLDTVYTTAQPHSAVGALVVLGGHARYVDFVYQPISDDAGVVTGILVQGTDVTERERINGQLRDFAARLQLATDAADLGIHEWDIVGGRITWDARLRELWGIGADDAITFETFLDGVLEEDRAATLAAVDRSMHPDSGGVYRAEYRVRDRVSGIVRWIRATGHVTFHDGAPQRLVGTVQDITREKLDEAALIEADRQKDVFLATLAHELRNPLAPIRSAAELLAMPNLTAEQVRWVHDVIARQAKHMASLLDDLLDVSRLTQGRMVITQEPIDLRDMLDAALETVQPARLARQHTISLDVPNGQYIVSGDAIRLSQVFTNLLSNAIKYMAPGGVITVTAEILGSRAVIRIRDEGDGMTPELLAEAFGLFRQAEVAPGRSNAGLGIGLALVRAIVHLHGGQVSAHSDGLGHGSTFVVELPLATAPFTASVSSDASLSPTVVSQRILVADDNTDAAESLAQLLAAQGHTVQTVADGVAALALADEMRPDVLVLDIGMPGLNGYEVAREIRRRAAHLGVRMIALTGWGKEDDRERALAAGFDAHLTKPPDLASLLRAVTQPGSTP